VDQKINPGEHPDPAVDLLRGYWTETVWELQRGGMQVKRSWLDPSGPRDATAVFTRPTALDELHALVWDEVSGLRVGRFLTGRQGVRTTLADAIHLGACVLPNPGEAAALVQRGMAKPRREFRSYTDRDGLDDALRAFVPMG
jgi:hypothetical protein